MAYKFPPKVAWTGYQVYKTSFAKTAGKVTVKLETLKDKESIKRDPYCCVIKAMVWNSAQLKTVAHIPRKSQHNWYFFLKERNSKIVGPIYYAKYCSSSVLA